MVYPSTPFAPYFDISLISKLSDVTVSINHEEFDKLLKWLCVCPKITSFRVNTLKYSTETVKVSIQNHLDMLSKSLNKNKIPKVFIHPILQEVIIIEKWDNEMLDLTTKEKEVIVDCSCGTAVLRGAHVYAPGVMAMQNGTMHGDIVSVYVDIAKKCKKGFARLYECPNKIFIGNGIVKMIRNEIYKEDNFINGIAIEMTDVISGCPSFNESNIRVGSGILQNIPSVLCGHILKPTAKEIVLDMCASPGNKTTHLAQLMCDKGTLIAIDKTPTKHKKLREKCDEFSLKCVKTYQFDSTKLCDQNSKNGTSVPPFAPETFDKILLDAPCSCLGSRPQFSNTITEKVLRSYVPLQRKLFENAVSLLKPGGKLVYSTCTITLGENEGIVSWALGKFDCLQLMPTEPRLGGPGWPGTNLTEQQLNLLQRFGPEQIDSVGFFVACFQKEYTNL